MSVSSTSAPAAIIDSCTPWITSGRLSTSASWHLPCEPAVVRGGQVELLEGGAHAAVEDDDALTCGLDEIALAGKVRHMLPNLDTNV